MEGVAGEGGLRRRRKPGRGDCEGVEDDGGLSSSSSGGADAARARASRQSRAAATVPQRSDRV